MLRLVVGNLNYSSWSMRPWLALERAGAAYKTLTIRLFEDPEWRRKVLGFSGAGKVPILVDGSSTIHESLAICEYIAEIHPEAKLWPEDRALRARARAVSTEMATSFAALRSEMPANLRGRRVRPLELGPEARRDVERIEEIWTASLSTSSGAFLFGDFSIADCFYFPVATRFRTYGVAVSEPARAYMEALFATEMAKKLEGLALAEPALDRYDRFLETGES